MRFVTNDISAELEAVFTNAVNAPKESAVSKIESASMGAMRQAGDLLKSEGRANIAAARFSRRWQNTWRVNVYPTRGSSIDAAAEGRHSIPYSAIFEKGGSVSGKSGMLWIPLETVPRVGRDPKPGPRQLAQAGVKLTSLRGRGKPLLGASVRVPRAQAEVSNLSVSLAKLRKGAAGQRGVVRAVPLYVGVSSVRLDKQFNILGVATSVRARLGDLYSANFNA